MLAPELLCLRTPSPRQSPLYLPGPADRLTHPTAAPVSDTQLSLCKNAPPSFALRWDDYVVRSTLLCRIPRGD